MTGLQHLKPRLRLRFMESSVELIMQQMLWFLGYAVVTVIITYYIGFLGPDEEFSSILMFSLCGLSLGAWITWSIVEEYRAIANRRSEGPVSFSVLLDDKEPLSQKKLTRPSPGSPQDAASSGIQAPGATQTSTQGSTSTSQAPTGPSIKGSIQPATNPGIQVSSSGSTGPAVGNAQQNLKSIAALVKKGLFVFFLAKGPRRTLELAEIDAKILKDGSAFFKELKTQYKTMRGFWRRWFSVWRLKHCNFVKFQKIRADRFLYHKDDIPDDPAYEYSPRPPDDVPPITPYEFELALDHCPNRCLWSTFHDCVEPPVGLFALHRIPKRNSTLHRLTDDPEFAWGIQAKHVPSFLRILVYHILIISGTFGFWGWWQLNHPGDLSNASIPASELVALISLFWTLSALPKQLREPG